jgi:outer membrane receptor protein involved in Fe transport
MTRTRRFAGATIAAAVLAAAAVASGSARAADAAATSVGELIVTAQKREERLKDVPIPVTAIPGDVLVDKGTLDLADYAPTVPNLRIEPVGFNSAQVVLRGVTTGSFNLPTVAWTIDGVPFSGLNDVPDVDPGDLARVEVLRGPQGTYFGSGALGGVINYVLKQPTFDRYYGQVQAGVSAVVNGHEAGYSVRGAVNMPLSSVLALRVSGYTYTDPGYIDNPVRQVLALNKVQAYGGKLSLLFQPSDDFSIKLNALYDHTNHQGSSEITPSNPGFPNTTGLKGLEQNYLPGLGKSLFETQAYSLTLNKKFGKILVTSLTGYNEEYDPSNWDWTFVFGPSAQQFGVTGAANTEFTRYRRITEELRASGSFGRLDWLIGGYYSHNKLYGDDIVVAVDPNTGAFVGNIGILIYPRNYLEEAVFANATYHFTDRLDLQIGGRESYYRESQDRETVTGPFTGGAGPILINPPVAASSRSFTYLVTPRYKITDDVMVYARVASGFRPGGPNQLSPGVKPFYDPDNTVNYEVGIKGDFIDHRLSIDASVFYIDWKSFQLQRFSTVTGLIYTANGSAAKSEGVELSASVRPWKGGTISGWFAYDDAVLTQPMPAGPVVGVPGDRLPVSPRFSGHIELDQWFPLKGDVSGNAGMSANFVGDRLGEFEPTETRQAYPAYTTVDLHVGAEYKSWSARLNVINVGNTLGLISGGLGYEIPYAFNITRPRTFQFTITRKF